MFRGEVRAWDQALWLYVILPSGFVAFFGSAPAEPFFRPDPRTDTAAARSGGRLVCVALDGCCMMPVFVVNR
jgi:hypothetical protein